MKLLFLYLYLIVLIGVPFFELFAKKYIKKKNPPFLSRDKTLMFHYVKNRGMMLGVHKNKPKFILITTIIVLSITLGLSFYIFIFFEKLYIIKIGLMLVSGGSLSNALERFIYRYVIDYFSFPNCIFKKVRNVVFNFADICIFVGFFIVFIGFLFI